MGKTRDVFNKIRHTKGTFHAKMGSVKDRNVLDLTEAEDIKNRQQEHTELYKKDIHDPVNYDGVITQSSQTSWYMRSCGPYDASQQTNLVEAMEYQLSYFKS